MLFAFHGVDKPGSATLRASLLPAHAAYQHVRSNPVGGPLLDADAHAVGTLIVFEAADMAEAEAIMQADPYVVGGLFETTHLHLFRAIDWPV